jgi:hypothetical protein
MNLTGEHPFHDEAADPGTAPARLAELAAAHPELHSVIVANPACYPALADWMRQYGSLPAAPAATSGAPATWAPVETATMAEPAISPERRGTRAKPIIIGAAAVLVVLLIGGGAWAWFGLFSKLGGAASPDAAVEKLLSAAESKDVVAMYGALSPAEASAFQGMLEEFAEIELPGPSEPVDFQKLFERAAGSVQITISDVAYSTHEVEADVAMVTLTDGAIVIDVTDPGTLADAYIDAYAAQALSSMSEVGFSEEEIEEQLDEMRDSMVASIEAEMPFEASIAEAERPVVLATVREGGTWYVSPMLTIAESAYQEAGAPVSRGAMIADDEVASFASPELAVEGAAGAVAEFAMSGDSRKLAAVLPLAERRLVSLYGPLIAPSSPQVGRLDLVQVDARADVKGDVARVTIDRLEFAGDGEHFPARLEIAGDCLNIETQHGEQSSCLSELPGMQDEGDAIGIMTVRENGSWHVSFLRTAAHVFSAGLASAAMLSSEGGLPFSG